MDPKTKPFLPSSLFILSCRVLNFPSDCSALSRAILPSHPLPVMHYPAWEALVQRKLYSSQVRTVFPICGIYRVEQILEAVSILEAGGRVDDSILGEFVNENGDSLYLSRNRLYEILKQLDYLVMPDNSALDGVRSKED